MKKRWFSYLVPLVVFGLYWSSSPNGYPEPKSTQITVYNQDLALVREIRKISLTQGIGQVRIDDVPALIEPTSLFFKSLTHPNAVQILEQNYDYDLVSQGKLRNRFLGKEVEVEMADPETHKTIRKKAKMLSTGWTFNGGGWSETGTPIVEIDGKVYVQPPGQIILPALSANQFLLRPTLNWMVQSRISGDEDTELSYLTHGLTWNANYVVVTDSKDTHLDLTGWVTLANKSGTAYPNARLQLMAGDVHVLLPKAEAYGAMQSMAARDEEKAASPFQEKSFFEYHLYTLDRPTSLLNDQTKQIELLSAYNVPMEKVFVYDGAPLSYGFYYDDVSYRENPTYGPQSNKKIWVMLEFMNKERDGLGRPLPKGTVRVYKTDDDGSREFIGEDQIDHTPKDEKVRLYLGDAFDVVGERKQTSFHEVVPHSVYDETFQIDLRNHKSEAATVRVVEHLWRWNDWTITKSSHSYRKIDSHTIEFPEKVAANGNTTITYTVRYKF